MNSTQEVFISFAEKARKKLEAKKIMRKETIYIGDLEEEVVIRGLTIKEVNECNEQAAKHEVYDEDYFIGYMACDKIQELAKELKGQAVIQEHVEVMEMLSISDLRELSRKVCELSGLFDETTITIKEELKNE